MMGDTAVLLGRFSPFHKGHESILKTLIKKYGEGGVVVMVGSSRFLTPDTIYTYTERRKMINLLFPKVRVVPLPDVHNNALWLTKIKTLEHKMNKKFVFYGGSKEDLATLATRFPTHVLIDRHKGFIISGTKVREAIKKGDYKYIKKAVNPNLIKYLNPLL